MLNSGDITSKKATWVENFEGRPHGELKLEQDITRQAFRDCIPSIVGRLTQTVITKGETFCEKTLDGELEIELKENLHQLTEASRVRTFRCL